MLLPFAFFYEVAVALSTVSPGQAAVAAQVEQFKDLLTGSMTDQVVTLENALKLAPGAAAVTPVTSDWGSVPVKLANTDIVSTITAQIDYASVPQVFRHLLYMYSGVCDGTGGGGYELHVGLNDDHTGVYDYNAIYAISTGGGWVLGGGIAPGATGWRVGSVGDQYHWASGSGGYFMIFNYARTDCIKNFVSMDSNFTFGGSHNLDIATGVYRPNFSAINKVSLAVGGANFKEFHGTLYGIP